MNSLRDRVSVIVRAVGERTLASCIESIEQQGFLRSEIIEISSYPFSDTLKKSYEAGIYAGREWTFCIDADVVLAPGCIASMLAYASEAEPTVCELQGYVLDKFFGGHRPAGNHLYRTRDLGLAIKNIPNEGVDLRPEHRTLESMRDSGLLWKQVPCLVGLHDFAQYYRDIYRKCFVQAHKHHYLKNLFDVVWGVNKNQDPDFYVAELGYNAGAAFKGRILIDSRAEYFDFVLARAGLKEKEPLSNVEFQPEIVEGIISRWVSLPLHSSIFPQWPSLKEILRSKPNLEGQTR